jgi:hypothetical protein
MYNPELIIQFEKELKVVKNSVVAYMNVVDCSDKTLEEISNGSYSALDSCFENIFFEEFNGPMSLLKNAGRAFGALTSLGGSYVFELQQKHYSDLYEALYLPRIEELKEIQQETSLILKKIGYLLSDFKKVMFQVEKVLKKKSSKKLNKTFQYQTSITTIQKFNAKYNSVFTNGFGGIVGGTTAVGAWGVVSLVGSASTGTAISSLSGVAASNATLAWFGGGSLAAGGAGMAGGFWVLGGIIAAPMIYFSTKSSYKKTDAIKSQKQKLINELYKLNQLEIEAKLQLREVRKYFIEIKKITNGVIPQIKKALADFNSASSFLYKFFGGEMNTKQKAAIKELEVLSIESMEKLGF